MSPRQRATREILYFIDRILPGSANKSIYEKRLKAMQDDEFEALIERLESGEETLALFCANLDEHKLDLQRNMEVGDELGHSFFQRLTLTDPDTGQEYETTVPHMVVDLPLRRQAQMLYKKMSIPEDNQSVDERSGQASNASKGSSLSYPELQVNAAKGLDRMTLELIKYRGGDVKAFNAMNRSITETGEASMDEISAREPTNVKSSQTLGVFFKAMHIKPEGL